MQPYVKHNLQPSVCSMLSDCVAIVSELKCHLLGKINYHDLMVHCFITVVHDFFFLWEITESSLVNEPVSEPDVDLKCDTSSIQYHIISYTVYHIIYTWHSALMCILSSVQVNSKVKCHHELCINPKIKYLLYSKVIES